MRVLGIDVGFAINGWSIVDKVGQKLALVDYGVITTESDQPIEKRITTVFTNLRSIIREYKPSQMSIESIFFFKNQKTVINVGQVRGVILLLGEMEGLEIFNYTPLQIKTAVTGYGRAEKKQVQNMVKMILGMKEIPKPDDAADAIAAAICHLNSVKYKK